MVENNVFEDTKDPLYSTDSGNAVSVNNDFGGGEDTAPQGNFTTAPYTYSLIATDSVTASVTSIAGANLSF